MNSPKPLGNIVDPVISLVPGEQLRDTLRGAFSAEQAAVEIIEEFFHTFPSGAWSRELLRTFAGSWKATHLKMLAIYGLCCRLQRVAGKADDGARATLFLAAARNAETSYEDLGLDYDGETHAELYEKFATALTGDDSWQLGKYRLPEALRFSRWIYRNMVVESIPVGLLTNMFSEIYNHGEYSIALPEADRYFRQHTHLSPEERRTATLYISAHVEDDTEAEHFLVVVDALNYYLAATGTQLDYDRAGTLFRSYLSNIAPVMQRLTEMMRAELPACHAAPLVAVSGGND